MDAIMICGAGHSGSTLLGLILNGQSQCFYMGEGGKVRFLGDTRKALRKRACKMCGESCPVWSTFVWDAEQPLYRSVAEHTGTRVIVDSTKNVAWLGDRIREARDSAVTPHLVMLVRDGRAVMNSRFRKYPERDPATQIRDWVEQIEATQDLFDDFDGSKTRLRYEDLATAPEVTIRGLCATVGLDFEPPMLEFGAAEHHPLGGNNGTQYLASRAVGAPMSVGERSRTYYEEHVDGIQLDLRWQTELGAAHRELFDRIAGRFNEPMAWEG
jgi:hypothetical protein